MTKISRKMGGLHPRTECTRQGRSAGIILAILSVLFLLGTGAARRAQAQTVTVLHSFAGGTADGVSPIAGLVRDSAGNLYGTAFHGGTSNNCPDGCGVVFKLDTSGTLTVLHSFAGGTTDGRYPEAGLVMDSSGNLYGTTVYGGTSTNCTYGCGTVYKLDTSGGGFALLHSFSGSDGKSPTAGLVRDSSGNLYGTTELGGASGRGTVFKLDTSLTLNVLHNFAGYPSDGADPESTLLLDSSGNLYGTTYGGGSSLLGTVYKLDTSGGGFAVLHDFAFTEGAFPWSGLVMDSAGNLYGTTTYSGTSTSCSLCGTVFKLDASNTLTVLHNFSGSDGKQPIGGLVRDSSGNLYGTTVLGGSYGHGAAFKLDTSNTLTVLHNFAEYLGDADGPESTLVMDSSGNFYGTTYTGGSYGYGTVFEISMTPQGGSQAITTQVNGLLAQGVINNGQDNSLVKTLQHAIQMMNAGKINGAIGNLEDFISEVNDLYNSGVLTEAQWNQMVSAANSIVEQLQAM